ncbi:hypothetical protein Vqi01_57140 [Micromonospora qiuiae]|uniref:Uncharacterized protein n=1 Tax=Micromonospora qiuiae TaxID=502268 RepID=A0ABQ4JLU5_9ACTN|nr:hypothetical protein Vqi01_57140 [Micromonospora qiuiae]
MPWIDGTLFAVSETWPEPHPDSSNSPAVAIPDSSTAARREPLIERVTSVLLVTITPGYAAGPAGHARADRAPG